MNKQWLKAAGIRAIKTFAQAILGGIAVGMALSDVDWLHLISVAVVAAIISILTSLAGLPEVDAPQDLPIDLLDEITDGRDTYEQQ